MPEHRRVAEIAHAHRLALADAPQEPRDQRAASDRFPAAGRAAARPSRRPLSDACGAARPLISRRTPASVSPGSVRRSMQDRATVRHDIGLRAAADGADADRRAAQQRMPAAAQLRRHRWFAADPRSAPWREPRCAPAPGTSHAPICPASPASSTRCLCAPSPPADASARRQSPGRPGTRSPPGRANPPVRAPHPPARQKTISVSAGRWPASAPVRTAPSSMAATEPLVSHAPRPKRRPFRLTGVNCASVALTVSRCGASRSRCRALPRGERRASRFERPGATGSELHVQPRLRRRGGQEICDPLFPRPRILRRQECRVHARQRNQLAQELLSLRHASPAGGWRPELRRPTPCCRAPNRVCFASARLETVGTPPKAPSALRVKPVKGMA